jgi:sugar diacid utilization regulator
MEGYMTLLELQAERDRLLQETIKLQEHNRKLKEQAKRLEIDIAWTKHEKVAA